MLEYYYQATEDSPKVHVNGKVTVKASVNDNYSLNYTLKDFSIDYLIHHHIALKVLPKDSSGIYVVFVASDVKGSFSDGFHTQNLCKDYCGYHLNTIVNNLPYIVMGNPVRCPNVCIPQILSGSTPSDDIAADVMASVFAHELCEAVTDPDARYDRAWEDSFGQENGDKWYAFGILFSKSSS